MATATQLAYKKDFVLQFNKDHPHINTETILVNAKLDGEEAKKPRITNLQTLTTLEPLPGTTISLFTRFKRKVFNFRKLWLKLQKDSSKLTSTKPDLPQVQLQQIEEVDSIIYSANTKIDKNVDIVSSKNSSFNRLPYIPEYADRMCLVLDLDETLVHSAFKLKKDQVPDLIVPITVKDKEYNVYVNLRPGVYNFLKKVSEKFEVVIFTASLETYASPLLDVLDKEGWIHHRLYRNACYNLNGTYVKDLSQLGRDLNRTLIIDNSPLSYQFHPQNAIPCTTWYSDRNDVELDYILTFLMEKVLPSDNLVQTLESFQLVYSN